MSVVASASSVVFPRVWAKKFVAYASLTKPRIIELLLITTVPAMIAAKARVPDPWLVFATVLGGTLSAGGANAFNMWWDRDIDAVMKRTSRRPLVQGQASSRGAFWFSVALEAVAFLWLATFVNLLSALIACAAAVFYATIYTMWLKRRSPANIVIGGAAGAAPVLVGWVAVTGSVSASSLVMFAIIFMWTPPHFWALAYKYRDDYRSAGVPMLPVVASERYTVNHMLIYTVLLIAVSLALIPVGGMGVVYASAALLAGAVFVRSVIVFRSRPSARSAMAIFSWSITYLTVVFLAVALDPLIHIGF